jgi:NAD(P)H-hydrate repair Nnr-like enzyme with NAD(P)H-hydrate dehydratase domain
VAHTLHVEKEEVERDPLAATVDLASKARAVVLCGGEDKFIANPNGDTWWVSVGGPGLGVSGSGDVQAGIVAGLVARGAAPEQAAAFGGWLHGSSGDALSRSVGPLGFLARELPGQVPGLLAELGSAGVGA